MTVRHLSTEELEAGLDHIRRAPRDGGGIAMITRRPAEGERELLESAEVDPRYGVTGDNWVTRGSSKTPDGSSDPNKQITIMSSRVIELVAQDRERWILAGDQFYVDLDLSEENVPAGTRLAFGTAVLEVSPAPHNGCAKFVDRFGMDAMRFVNSEVGRLLHLRGVNARVHRAGSVRVGEVVTKVVGD